MLRYPIVFVSGFCALVYQIVWMRILVHVFGLSVHSTTTTVCAFMAGLGLGSYLAPRVLRRWRGTPWALYAAIEVGIGITSAAVPIMVEPIKWAYIAAGSIESAALLTTIKFVLSVAVMLVPTTLMGLTLPVLVEACVDSDHLAERTSIVGTLYGFNTAGAAMGCLLVGFVFLYLFGITLTVACMAGLNFAVAAVAYLAYGRRPAPNRAAHTPDVPIGSIPFQPGRAKVLLFIYGLIGLLSLGYEIAWFRVLVFYLQSATYSFSILLATYLVGLALGSLAFSRLVEPRLGASSAFTVTIKWIAIGQVLLALMTSCTLVLSKAAIPVVWSALISLFGADSWAMISAQKIGIASIIVIPPTLIMGATFPMIVRLYKSFGSSDASSVAHLYAVNTAGAVVGSVVTGFVMFDVFGMQRTLSILSFASLCIGLGMLFFFGTTAVLSRRLRATVGALVAAWILILAFQPSKLVESLIEETRGVDIIFNQESAADITMVGENDHGRELIYHDGRGTCSTWPIANYVARQLAYSSMVQNPGAVDVLIISMGCGNTASAFTAFPIERLDIVDLSPSVFDAARYFEFTNLGVMKDPRVRTFADDGRNYLLTTQQKYDIIQIELPSIHTAGVVNLYTREFYEIARKKLKPGGVLSQWLDVNQTGREVGYMLLNTMREVFPNTTVWSNKWAWWFNGRNTGSELDCGIDYAVVKRLLSDEKVARDMGRVLTSIADVFSNIVASPRIAQERSANRRVIDDDHTYVDFLVPRLENTAAFGGGVGYYKSRLRDLFRNAWRATGMINPWVSDAWAGNSFHPKGEVESGGAQAVDQCLGDFPEALRQSIKELQPTVVRGRAGWRPAVFPKSLDDSGN